MTVEWRGGDVLGVKRLTSCKRKLTTSLGQWQQILRTGQIRISYLGPTDSKNIENISGKSGLSVKPVKFSKEY